jgi:16S rRNA (uracil1498-N3)-methyltransferase
VNSIYLFRNEVNDDSSVIVKGERLEAIYKRHTYLKDILRGAEVKYQIIRLNAGAEQRGRGFLNITMLSQKELRGNFELLEPVLQRLPLILSVAIPRPQTIKKLVQLATTVGMKELRFFRSDLGEKSYWSSKQLRPEIQREEVVKGLEQAWESEPPLCSEHLNLSSILALREKYFSLAADTVASAKDNFDVTSENILNKAVQLLIGPEKGWSPDERELFTKYCVPRMQLGSRILRVETAAALLVGRFFIK